MIMDSSVEPQTYAHESDSADENVLSTLARSPWPRWILLGLVMLLIGGLAGYWLGRSGVPADNSVDVGFARDMSIHHEQAVQMAALVYDRTEDEAIRSLAFDILTTQQGQIGIMSGWLDAWDRPWTSAGPRMEWMGMPTEGLMAGMATAEEMAALRNATGEEADIIFLRLMIPHHRSGIDMAAYTLENATQEPVRVMARGMAEAQELEIAYMQEMLVGKGQPPAPDQPGTHKH